jgi:hypothetical protein
MKLSATNFPKLAAMLLPTFMRSASVVELFKVLSVPFSHVQDAFFANRDKNLYNLHHNGQICHLRAVLNDAFQNRTKSFLIEDAEDTGVWQYAKDEPADDEFLSDQFIIPDVPDYVLIYDEETMTKFADFTVKIPAELDGIDNINLIRALVNQYKLISKKAIYELY